MEFNHAHAKLSPSTIRCLLYFRLSNLCPVLLPDLIMLYRFYFSFTFSFSSSRWRPDSQSLAVSYHAERRLIMSQIFTPCGRTFWALDILARNAEPSASSKQSARSGEQKAESKRNQQTKPKRSKPKPNQTQIKCQWEGEREGQSSGWVGFGSESLSHFRSDQGRVRTAAAAVTTDGSAKVDFVIMAGINFRLIVAEKRWNGQNRRTDSVYHRCQIVCGILQCVYPAKHEVRGSLVSQICGN